LNADELQASDDATLLERIARRDEAALREVARRHRQPLHAFARRLLSDDSRAEEVIQEVLVRLWEQPSRFDPARGALRSYLLSQTHGRALDLMRADDARRRREERTAHAAQLTGPDTAETVVATSVAREVRRALSELPESERALIELAYFEGLSYREAAARTGVPEGTAKARIRVGLTKLRRTLARRDLGLS
jgi:RNA polymerase sigma-70 factor (ECF subfamily)